MGDWQAPKLCRRQAGDGKSDSLVEKPAGPRPRRICCFSLSPNVGNKTSDRLQPRSSVISIRALSFSAGLPLMGWGSLTLRRAVCFTSQPIQMLISSRETLDQLSRHPTTQSDRHIKLTITRENAGHKGQKGSHTLLEPSKVQSAGVRRGLQHGDGHSEHPHGPGRLLELTCRKRWHRLDSFVKVKFYYFHANIINQDMTRY